MGCVKKCALYSSKGSCNVHLGQCHSPVVCHDFGKHWKNGVEAHFSVVVGLETEP